MLDATAAGRTLRWDAEPTGASRSLAVENGLQRTLAIASPVFVAVQIAINSTAGVPIGIHSGDFAECNKLHQYFGTPNIWGRRLVLRYC